MELFAERVSAPLPFPQPATRHDPDEPVQSEDIDNGEEDEFSMMQQQYSWLREPIQSSDADEQIINYSIEEQNYDKEKSEPVCCGY